MTLRLPAVVKSLWFEKPRLVGFREELCGLSTSTNETPNRLVRIRTRYSGISAGTEMLVYRGEAPLDIPLEINDNNVKAAGVKKSALNASFTYPVKYGYCNVGTVVEAGQDCSQVKRSDTVFTLHPHETEFEIDENACHRLPSGVDPRCGVFLANLETAIGLVHDCGLRFGENVVVMGLGVVGILCSALLQMSGANSVLGVDLYGKRRDLAESFGLKHTCSPADLPQAVGSLMMKNGPDLVVEVSGNTCALQQAIDICGLESRVVVGSWYGTKDVKLDLGTKFHRNRLAVLSSQVLHLSPSLGPRWTKDRRFEIANRLLIQLPLSKLITDEYSFEEAHLAYKKIDNDPESTLQVILNYEGQGGAK